MIPKNKRRTIMVDGIEYEYCVTGCVTIFIRNTLSKESWDWHQEWKEKWKSPVTPEFVKELILAHNSGKEPVWDNGVLFHKN